MRKKRIFSLRRILSRLGKAQASLAFRSLLQNLVPTGGLRIRQTVQLFVASLTIVMWRRHRRSVLRRSRWNGCCWSCYWSFSSCCCNCWNFLSCFLNCCSCCQSWMSSYRNKRRRRKDWNPDIFPADRQDGPSRGTDGAP